MQKGFLRNCGAFLVMAGLWFGSFAALTQPALGQTSTPSTDQSKAKDPKDAKAAKSTNTKAKPAPTPGGLTVKEDPAQIGKRNINGGMGDKLFGWFGGSKEKEMQIGRQMAAEVEQGSKMVDDPMINEYVNRVGQNIVLHSDAKVPFTIKVIDSDDVNAFALPGGFFFVNKGLLLAAENESELAGVMAHEIAHVAARHSMENTGKGSLLNYGMMAGMIFGGGIVGPILQSGGGILGGLAMMKFTRGAEEEADRLGVQYLYAAGYDPTGMSTMFEKLASQNKKKPGKVAKLFSTHPQNLDRRDTSLALVARFPEKEEYVISTSEFQRVKGYLMKVTNAKAGVQTDFDNPEEGRPTLKKRQPDSPDANTDATTGDTGTSSSSSSSSDSGPPKLKKRDNGEPAPSPTPEP